MPEGLKVSVVIPSLNEARNLPHVFDRMPEELHEVILVDGRSTDDTVDVARRLYPDVKIVHQTGRGKGNALAAGFAECTGDVIVMIDADGSTDPAEMPRFVQAIAEGAQFAKGSRFLPEGGSDDITPTRRFGNFVLCGIVNTLFGTRFTDLCYGYIAFDSSYLDALDIDCPGFEVETFMNIRAAKLDMRVAEVPSFESVRIHGESNLHPFRDGLRVLRTIARERLADTPKVAPPARSEPPTLPPPAKFRVSRRSAQRPPALSFEPGEGLSEAR
jgi:glycosyltransferase involved in cell wall biosynthesis